jgi:hypothetical protein
MTDINRNNVKTPVCLVIVIAPIKKKDESVEGIPHQNIALIIVDNYTGFFTTNGYKIPANKVK